MNILFVGHEENLNGASLSLLGMIDEMIDNNNIYVLTSFKEGPFIEELKKRNINIIYSRYYRWMIYKQKNKFKWIIKRIIALALCLINYLSAYKLKNLIKKEKIEIIHTNSGVINIGAILGKLCDVPHIWHLREYGQEDFNFYYVFSQKYSYKFIEGLSDRVVVVSNALAEKYKKFIDQNKIEVIHNGINSMCLQEKNFKRKAESIKITICGRIGEAKGQKEAILAINELKNRGYNNLILSIAGSGDITELQKYIDKNNLSSNVKFLGQIRDLKVIRKEMDLELVCSKNEAFGRVTIEAMMSMIPVIGANTGGTKELIQDGFNGMTYIQGNYKDLADKIEILLKNKNEIERMGRNAYNYAKDFTSEINAKNIYSIYEKIINFEN